MADTMTDRVAAEPVIGRFTRDQVEMLSTRRVEPQWLRERRLAAYETFLATPMPTNRAEDWRYTDISRMLKLEQLEPAEEVAAVGHVDDLPSGLATSIQESGASAGTLVQVDASVVHRTLPPELEAQGVIFSSLDMAVREHGHLVERYLSTAATPEEGKFSALNAALWSGGTFLYVPKGVRVELPLRAFRWLVSEGGAVFGRTLVVAEAFAEVALVDEFGSEGFDAQTLSCGATEIFAGEGSKVTYVALQRFGSRVVHLTTDRLSAGRDAKITSLYSTLGSDLTRAEVKCALSSPGAHVDMLGIYLGDGTQHLDHQTLQDHIAPHASSNLLFKGALLGQARSVFRGMIRVRKGAQRTNAFQTNRNLLLSKNARADSLPNLEIAADDVRCSHAATIGQLEEEEVFYLLSRGIPKAEAMRLVVLGFFGEVLSQVTSQEIRREQIRAIERKLGAAAG